MKNVEFIVLFSILCLIVVMPAAFAADNETAITAVDVALDDDIAASDISIADNLTDDCYFDANVANDTGNGSADNPYKELRDGRIHGNSTVHLANGEYDLNFTVNLNNLSIIGQDASKTIVRVNSAGFTVSDSLTLRNLTLIGSRITNNGNFYAENVFFNDSHSSTGGVIYSSNSKALTNLDGCTFKGSYADNGGAIYIKGGVLNISNSFFFDNYAVYTGGAIYAENALVHIKKSRFANSRSNKDAGGAIYILRSNFDAYCLEITDSNATFGGAITSLNSNMNLTDFKSSGNCAAYDGGSIYFMYGVLNIINSTFANDSARNGGSIFISDATTFNLIGSTFVNDSALNTGGAVYSITDGNQTNLTDNTFIDNHASFADDTYINPLVNLTIGNGNYILIRYNPSFNGTLPDRYDLRSLNQTTPVKNQGNGGNCWAFAQLAALESCILKATGNAYDLSEENMKNLMALYSQYGWRMETNTGGYDKMGTGYLASWIGAILDSEDEYNAKSLLSPVLNSFIHVQNIVYLLRTAYTDNDAIKMAIMDYGAVESSMYWGSGYQKGASYYYTGTTGANHAIAIVGWDDNYSKNNFKTAPPGDGAWIIKNSWGTSGGEDGYYYVSYYDKRCAPINSSKSIFTFILNDTVRFDKNYQYDIPGWTDYFLNSSSTVWYKNRFVSTDNEYLLAVSTYFEKDTWWDLSIYVNDVLRHTQSGFAAPSYSTIDLSSYIPLQIGDVFEVVFKITVDGEAAFPISEYVSLNKRMYCENTSFLSYDGENWTDLFDLKWKYSSHTYDSQVACIKAFTALNTFNTSIVLNVTPYYESVISAVVLNEFGNVVRYGNVTFNVEGKNISVPISDGVAVLNYIFENLGPATVFASYENTGYYSSQANCSTVIGPSIVNMTLNVTKDVLDAFINVSLSKTLDGTVKIILNGNETFYVNVTDGQGFLALSDLYYGNYTVDASFNKDKYYCENASDSFSIDYLNTYIQAEDLEIYYNSTFAYSVRITDRHSRPISKNVTFSVNGVSRIVESDSEGIASILLSLPASSYVIDIVSLGEGRYLSSNATRSITVYPTIFVGPDSVYTTNMKYVAKLLDLMGNPLSNRTVALIIDGTSHSLTSNSTGEVAYIIDLAPGSHVFEITNPATGEERLLNITVFKLLSIDSTPDRLGVMISIDLMRDFDGEAGIILNENETYDVNITGGVGFLTLNDLSSGNYTVRACFDAIPFIYGDVYDSFSIDYVKTFIQAEDLEIYYNTTFAYSVRILDSYSNPLSKNVTFSVNGIVRTVKSGSDGMASITLSLPVSSYQITVMSLAEGKYLSSNATKTIRIDSTISLPSVVRYTLNSKYAATLLDSSGNPLSNQKVSLVIGGVAYSLTTNSNGVMSYTVKLDPNKYSVKVINPLTGESKLQNINVVKRITLNKDVVMYYGAGTSYKVKVFDDNGNVAKGVKVTFKINGKEYIRTSDSNGYASFKINLAPKTYTIFAVYNGYKVTNKITVKSTIVAKNIAVKKTNPITFNAKLLDSKGKVLKNKVITFKFKGQTYKVKTNANGIASLKIANKFKVGKYTIVSSYGNLNAKNTITIK